MSTALKVTCRQCGDVEVPLQGTHLLVAVSPQQPQAQLQFGCPTCGSVGVQPADQRVVSLLLAAGISVVAPRPEADSVGETHTRG
ncbi:MAG TPA: hypothetical protein VKB75_07525 [Jatrophihabitans sp.]|nr:hypothetical protein [Jatrophihabitans sp.]